MHISCISCFHGVIGSSSSWDPLVPALLLFGDSVVDVGNNNNLQTLVKANFLPYGRDFNTHKPTGRFSNGKLATDFTAEYLGFTSYQPAYLSQEARGRNILTGVNFASAASGYYEPTAQLYGALTLARQLEYYRDWQRKVSLLPDQFSDILMRSYSTLIQVKPAILESIQYRSKENWSYSSATNWMLASSHYFIWFRKQPTKLPGLKLVVFDIYQPLLDMITKPSDSGQWTCSNATEYVFWDGFHPSEAANEKLAQDLLEQDLISSPSAHMQ
ncbi:GDSL esterase/lipase [Sesamum angolense]|uniref:GDSL esterase/lipase n=1 Tax=Sesamum angolense TaxID=2727404 RepID=A0AAE1WEW1_9LAMI|nr:GDSL esterase/lipase [Sesamum angolense]